MNQHQMAMTVMPNPGGPVGGTPLMNSGSRGGGVHTPRMRMEQLNTYIYDYFLRTKNYDLARAMFKASKSGDGTMTLVLHNPNDPSPSGRDVNGVADAMDSDVKEKKPADLPEPGNKIWAAENCFLEDWWIQFWELWEGQRQRGNGVVSAYIAANHNATRACQENQTRMLQREQPMMAMNFRQGQNGMQMSNEIQKRAMMNNVNTAGMSQQQLHALRMVQMRQSQMGGHMPQNQGMPDPQQRSQSPNPAADAPSPKRQRMDGAFNGQAVGPAGRGQGMPGQPPGMQNPNGQMLLQNGMDANFVGSAGGNKQLEGLSSQGSPGMYSNPEGGNHALQDYQMQLMLLEQQNKKRLLMARQEQDNLSSHRPGAGPNQGPPGFNGQPGVHSVPSPGPTMRNGHSPNPAQMKQATGTPKMQGAGLPGSPAHPEGMMQNPQFAGQYQMNAVMMPPPSSHSGAQYSIAPGMTPQMAEAQRRMPNGPIFPGPGMMPQSMGGPPGGPQQGGQPQMGTPRQPSNMAPPPVPAAGATGPSSPQQAPQPPTPSQTKGNLPKGKKDKAPPKKAANKSKNQGGTGANAAAEAAEAPTPTPSTPITPMHNSSFAQSNAKNGAQTGGGMANVAPQATAQQQATTVPQQQQQPPAMDPNAQPFGGDLDGGMLNLDSADFASGDVLENFDFDSFLVTEDSAGFGFNDLMSFGGDGSNGVEPVGDM